MMPRDATVHTYIHSIAGVSVTLNSSVFKAYPQLKEMHWILNLVVPILVYATLSLKWRKSRAFLSN
jgi:hypothetical protein